MGTRNKDQPRYELLDQPRQFYTDRFCVFDHEGDSGAMARCSRKEDAEEIVGALNCLHYSVSKNPLTEKGPVEIAERIFRSARLDEERLDWLDEFSCDRLEDVRGHILNSNGDETVRDVIDHFMKVNNSERDKL